MRTLDELFVLFPATAEKGLDADSVARSQKTYGPNRLTPLPREPLWKKFLEKFDEPIIKILLAAALLSLVVDLFQEASATYGGIALGLIAVLLGGAFALRQGQWVPSLMFGLALVCFFMGLLSGHTLVEGLAVMVAVILATGVAFLSEYRSDREFEILNAQKESLQAKVIRGGAFHTLPLEEVVVGDAVLLEMGDEIPADGRLIKATDLYVDQSLMTGESEPVPKRARIEDSAEGFEQPGCLYRGTQIVDGVGQMIVAEVGDATYLGQIARRLSAEEEEEEEEEVPAAEPSRDEEKRVKRKLTISKELTPLQLKLKRLADLISNVGYIAALAIFLAQLALGLYMGDVRFSPRSDETLIHALADSGRSLLDYFIYMVIVIVVAVPEGLPMSVTVSLALAMRKMTKANSLVRQLVACETIGSATVICSDKTGTLTQNKMKVVRLGWEGIVFDRGAAGWPQSLNQQQPWPSPNGPLEWIVLNAAVNSTANLETKEGKILVAGNSTEGALLQWLREYDLEYGQLRLQFPMLYTLHFSSERKRMTSVISMDRQLVVLVKGAPEWLLEHSTHELTGDGTPRPWTADNRAKAENWIKDSSAQAMRTLAFGYALLPPDCPADEDDLHALRDSLETSLVYVGMVAIRDPLRDDVKEAVDRCGQAGIEVKMITGDNVETARAIAFDIGLVDRRDAPIDTPEAAIITSATFNNLTDEELKSRLPSLRVLARARPLDKFRMVKLLQELDQVVAVTGDGTNDAPALKKADVGLAMGIAGTEVAKEASKIVLLDDAFSTIVKAVNWGRSLYENIQRFLQFQLTINVSALTIAFLGPFLGIKPPFTVLQLLWINVIMDTFASIALCSEPPREGVMKQPPKGKEENILTRPMLWTIFTTAAFFIVVMIVFLVGMEGTVEKPGWFAGTGNWSKDFPKLTTRQVSIFFSIYVFFQVWNQINCRSLTPRESGLKGLFGNPTFLAIAGSVGLVQILIVSLPSLGEVFKVEPLGLLDWLWIIGGTAVVLAFSEGARLIRRALENP